VTGHEHPRALTRAAPAHEVLVVGLGTVAQTHLRALEQIPGAEVTAGVDIAGRPGVTFRGCPVPVYPTLRAARDRHDPGIVVVATPTPTHAAVCAEVARTFSTARILVEKPAAHTLADARFVLDEIGRHQPVEVAYHMAFSPEVSWGEQLAQARAGELGAPTAIEASSTDPYYDELESASSRFGDSWLDSGINSLSVLSRFAELAGRTSLRCIGEQAWSAFEARIACRAGGTDLEALILTSWHVTDAARTTRISYDSGAELVMDHTAVAGYLVQNQQISAVFGSDRSIPRRERHYRALYKWWLVDGNPIMPARTSRHLHDLLLQPADGPQA
jgi:predicted dehydrogenase